MEERTPVHATYHDDKVTFGSDLASVGLLHFWAQPHPEEERQGQKYMHFDHVRHIYTAPRLLTVRCCLYVFFVRLTVICLMSHCGLQDC